MAEQLIRNEQVAGSIPVTSSKQTEGTFCILCLFFARLAESNLQPSSFFLIDRTFSVML